MGVAEATGLATAALGFGRCSGVADPSPDRVRTRLRQRARSFLVASLAVALASLALVARESHISALPLDFHAARQYHSAQLARSYYVLHSDGMPDWKRRVARSRLSDDPPLELPVFPFTVATVYRLSGGERLWIPRLLSSLFWIAGAVLLFALARRFVQAWAALLAVVVYLFFPFPLIASTSFQPDPLMVMLLLAASVAILRHHERPTRSRFVVAALLSAAAVFVKPGIATFFVLPLFAALAIVRTGFRDAIVRPSAYVFAVLTLLPALAFYAYSSVTEQFVEGRIGLSVNPKLLGESFYWRDWLAMIEDVLRPPFFGDRLALAVLIVSISSVFVARTATQRAVLVSLWTGYAAFGLTVSNYVSTHNYYSLPLVPIAALSLAVVAAALAARARPWLTRRWVQVGVTALVVAFAAVGVNVGGTFGVPKPDREYERRAEVYERIGEVVHHTPRALVLGGTGLWYHAWIAGRYWPEQGDLEWERRYNGLRRMEADERFVTTDESYYPAVGTMDPAPSVFIVGEPIELALQPDLSILLSDFQLLAATPDYLIFDLARRASKADRGARNDGRARVQTRSSAWFFYRFPPAWSGVERGMAMGEVARVLGRPRRIERHSGLRKAVQTWFYGARDKWAIVFVDGEVFAKAQRSR
jgi:hypothetical protein